MKHRALRILRVLVLVEVAYLVLANLALNLPLTQALLNQHRPDKYRVQWERAWTWYPFRVYARGIVAGGQTSSQQWQIEVSKACASVSAVSLLRRTLRISAAQVEDVDFRLRPRLRPDRDDSAVRAFYPTIPGWDPDLLAVPRVRKPGPGWNLVVEDLRANGDHRLWIRQVQGELSGVLSAKPNYRFRGGPFSLAHGAADIGLSSLSINGQPAVSRGGTVRGSFEMAPFVPSQNRGAKWLAFLNVDADVDLEVESLDFLDTYLRRFNGMELDGRGNWRGRLRYGQGELLDGTAMTVSASELDLNASPYRVAGSGQIRFGSAQDDPASLSVGILFGDLSTFHGGTRTPLFSGQNLAIEIRGDNRILPDQQWRSGHERVTVRIPSVTVPDLNAFQYLLPTRWPARLNGGSGELAAEATFSATQFSADLRLLSHDADVALSDYRFATTLDLGVRARAGASQTASIDLSGSYLRLDDARLVREPAKTAALPVPARQEYSAWNASLSIPRGVLGISMDATGAGQQRFADLARELKGRQLRDVLADSDAELEVNLDVSDLGWLNLLFRNPLGLEVSGAGEAQAQLRMRSGWLAKGTRVAIRPRALQVQLLDYVAEGEGSVTLAVERGGETPDLALEAVLMDSRLRRRNETQAVIEQVELELRGRAQSVSLGSEARLSAIDVRIPSARVSDMTVYNRYIPEAVPLRLSAGEAQLSADIRLEREAASGYVRLVTEGLQSRLDDQSISGELTLDVNLAGGAPANMAFDISGSSLQLDDFRVAGEEQRFDEVGWAARFDLDRGQVVWKEPVRLDADGRISLQDSRPIVALLANQRGRYGWIEKLLTTGSIAGRAQLRAAGDTVAIPYAFASSDKIDLGAKGVMTGLGREGMLFVRYRKLRGVLKVKDGERNFDVFGAQQKFADYVPGETGVFTPREPANKSQ
ncbi:hypothetical protein [Marinobacterium nitratireducens]|nr:hypothetical protein [Marinobacterium nitratireducens]